MTTTATPSMHQLTDALRRGAVQATFAASIYNTQPWRFLLTPNRLDIMGDRTRQLQVLDPAGRQLIISCGCALFNARVAVAACGFDTQVDRCPATADSAVLARIRATQSAPDSLADLDAVIESRRTNRKPFTDEEISREIVDILRRAAQEEDSHLHVITAGTGRASTLRLSQRAANIHNMDAAYRAELQAWTTTDLARLDGLPTPADAAASISASAASSMNSEVTGRDSAPIQLLPKESLFLLSSRTDEPKSWLRLGEALQRVLLELTRHGLVARPVNQVIEVASTRLALRQELNISGFPQILLRIGRAATTPSTHRRRLVDVIVETT